MRIAQYHVRAFVHLLRCGLYAKRAIVSASIASLVAGGCVHAETVVSQAFGVEKLYWNGGASDPAGGSIVGGSGVWNTVDAVWADESGRNASPWPGGPTVAVFSAAAGHVSVPSVISVQNIEIESGYTLETSRGTAGTLSFPIGRQASINVTNANAFPTISVNMQTEQGLGGRIPLLEGGLKINGRVLFVGEKTYLGTTSLMPGSQLSLGQVGFGEASVAGDIEFLAGDGSQQVLEVYTEQRRNLDNRLTGEDTRNVKLNFVCGETYTNAAKPEATIDASVDNSDFGGQTNISDCALRVMGKLGGSLRTNSSGLSEIRGTGVIGGANTVAKLFATVVRPGAGPEEIGTLHFGGDVETFDGTADATTKFHFKLFDDMTGDHDMIEVPGALRVNGDLHISFSDPDGRHREYMEGDYDLVSYGRYGGTGQLVLDAPSGTNFTYAIENDALRRKIVLHIVENAQ
ncbi:hypothetical protein [Martelella endophytica]|uniref:Uncharacterized protein n=1 Tax=Martelella endophytica TaxID=1486262 RepID=A0A0D5LR97_MAREN|nr:hypothetical protein [Martelella endophytica]AJY46651.1 hypothetical protein TM49_14745 [Martelella endophytica]